MSNYRPPETPPGSDDRTDPVERDDLPGTDDDGRPSGYIGPYVRV